VTRLERRVEGVSRIVVNDVRRHRDRIEGTIHVGAAAHPIHITAPGAGTGQGADPFVPLALLPALALGADLGIEGTVAPETVAAADRVQAVFRRWFPRVRPVRVEGAARTPGARRPGAVSLFSGGVDSFHTVLGNRGRLTHLLFVHGFDVPLTDAPLRARVGAALRGAARELELPLVEAETNLRDFLDRYVSWELAFGAAITSVAMALGGTIGEVFVPSSSAPPPVGSHPDLDPLWTTSEQAFFHHGEEATRFEKVARIAASATAMRCLRVCWLNPDGSYNCGRCEKCLRTMSALRLVGAADRSPTFPQPLDLPAIERAALSGLTWGMWEEMRRAASRAGDEALAASIGVAVRRYRVAVALEPARRVVRGLRAAPRRLARLLR
jgi:hypothetical protein